MDEPASVAETPDCVVHDSAPIAAGDALLMTVEIGDGRQDTLRIPPSADPISLASEFAAKHSLDPATTALLTDLIRQHRDTGKRKPAKAATAHAGNSVAEVTEFRQKVRMKTGDKMSVHERLYARGKKPKEEKPREEKPRATSATSRQNGGATFNYGEWLYIKGVQSKEAQKRTTETRKKEEVDQQGKELTFKPTINRKSSLLSPRYQIRTEELLIKKEAEKKEKIEMLKSQTESERLRECSFTPKINTRSQQLDTSHSSQRFVDLFQEASKRKERQLERVEVAVKSEFSFRPSVRGNKGEVDKEAFLDRIVNSKKRFEEEMERIRKEIVTDVDESGQRLFEPSIPKDPRFERSLDGQSVHDHLYALKDHKKQSIERLAQELDENIRAAQRSTKVTQQSERILESFRRRAYESLFKLLDSDGDGIIGSGRCAEDALESKTAEILEPVLRDIRDKEDGVDFAEFQKLLDRLMGRLTMDAKSQLLRREPKPEEPPPSSNAKVSASQRSLSVKSDQLASKRRESLPGDIYTRRISEKRQTEEKVERLKRTLELRQMQQCTFKPFTSSGKSK